MPTVEGSGWIERGEGEEGRWTKNESDLRSGKYALGELMSQASCSAFLATR